MLHFYPGAIATVYLTLTELATLTAPAYLFTFRRRVAGAVLHAELQPVASNERSDCFEIDVDALFAGQPAGLWLYEVREVAVPETIEGDRLEYLIAADGAIIEIGMLELHGSGASVFTQPGTITTFIQP